IAKRRVGKRGRPTAMRRCVIALLAWLVPWGAAAQMIGLTFDDGLDPARNPKAALWNARILHALERQQVHAMIFPTLKAVGGEAGMTLLEQWVEAGHAVGNHTADHRNLSSEKVTLQQFIEDV